jgi:hypothetical protein
MQGAVVVVKAMAAVLVLLVVLVAEVTVVDGDTVRSLALHLVRLMEQVVVELVTHSLAMLEMVIKES